jgi:UDP-N-acetylglucosamine 2-epimerase
VLTVVGARPQFVKAAAVSRALRRRHGEVLVHTGQHYDAGLSGVFFRDLGLPEPDAHLGGPAGGPGATVGSTVGPGARLAAMVRGLAREVGERRPDAVLVFGDTDSTQAGAFAAREARVPLVHVEAGLRSDNLRMPEEVNRIVADHLAGLNLCPTPRAAERLARERVSGRTVVVGDVMLDVCLEVAAHLRAAAPEGQAPHWPGAPETPYLAATVHRAENTDDPVRLSEIVRGLDGLGLPVVMPCHPRTRAALRRAGLERSLSGLSLVEPLAYPDMLALLLGARALLTDSGGLQKEAMFLGVPCLTLREETEWPETVELGWNRLVPAEARGIARAVAELTRPPGAPDLAGWGGGRAAEAVVEALEDFLGADGRGR